MNKQEIINQAKETIKLAEKYIANCKHEWTKPIYDPENEKVGYGSVQDGAGSDPHWSYAGYMNKEKPRWSRTCIHCGYKEYTYKQSPVIIGNKPNFNK